MMYEVDRGKMAEIYWLNRLSGELPKISLPRFDLKAAPTSGEGKKAALPGEEIPASIFTGLEKVGGGSAAALFILLLGGLKVMLHRYTGVRDLVVGTVSPGEEGSRARILFCRNRVDGELTLKETLNRVKEQSVEDFRHSDYSFGGMYRKLLTRNPSGHLDIFKVAFIYEDFQQKSKILDQFELLFILSRREGKPLLRVEYDENKYSPAVIRQFTGNWLWLFHRLETKLNTAVRDIDIVSPPQRRELMTFNRTPKEYPLSETADRLFEQQAEKTPDRLAVAGPDPTRHDQVQLTYGELNRQADRLARRLRQQGLLPRSFVGVMMERAPGIVTAIMGILKSGAAFLPLDRDVPTNRIVSMLADSRAPLLVSRLPALSDHAFTALQELDGSGAAIHVSSPRLRITDFDSLPFPDRSLMDMEKYNRYIGQAIVKNRVLIQASRGCPHDCAYCYRIWPRRQVSRSAANIFREIRYYYDLGIRKFDIFMLNIAEGRRLFQMIIQNRLEGLELYFPNGFRGDLLNREYIDLMVEAGAVNFALALETASPRLQKLINKNLNLDKFRDNIEYTCRKYPRIILELFTMHGIPTETEAEALTTLEFIKSLKWIHFPYVNVLKIYRGTGMERLALENGISRRAIARSENMAWHQWSETLPFDRSFTSRYQADFLSEYLLSRDRLLAVLPHQMNILTEDEFIQKYDSYFPEEIGSVGDFLKFTGLGGEDLAGLRFRDEAEDREILRDLNRRLADRTPDIRSADDAFRVLLLDLSQFFSESGDSLYDVVDPPLGLLYLLTYLSQKLGSRVSGRILKSRLDFDSYEELRAALADFKPQLIGIRTLSYYRDFFHRTVALLREWGIDIPIIAGGPYATVDYGTLLQDGHIDLAVLGEGELTLVDLIDRILAKGGKWPADEELMRIPGIALVPGRSNCRQQMARDILMADQLGNDSPPPAGHHPGPVHGGGDPAYVMYTSGSTGKPKGVVVEHRSLVNVSHWFGVAYGIDAATRVMQLTHHTFDPFVEQVFATLGFGGLLCMGERELAADADAFADFVVRHCIHIFNFVPRSLKELFKGGRKLPGLRALISGGERLDEAVKNRLLALGYPLYNHYGPTETTVDALMTRCGEGPVTLGRPIDNVCCYICDNGGRLLPVGIKGELWIGGSGVARGYLNNPQLTRENFTPSPAATGYNGMLYRSGDMARWRPDGTIEYLGRLDEQVKVWGQRIELGEIENHLLKHPRIDEAVVVLKPGVLPFLCAYFTANGAVELGDLREFLSRELPEAMIPAYFIRIDCLPLTAGGKVDREMLPDPVSPEAAAYKEPTDEIEETLSRVWSEVLETDSGKVGIDANFFELGGDSIKVIQISARLRQQGLKVKSGDIFLYPTIKDLKKYVIPLDRQAGRTTAPGTAVMTPIQRWFFERNVRDPHHFNQAVMLTCGQGFDEQAVRAIFRKIQAHHDALRMTFARENGEVRQVNHGSDYPFSLELFDWCDGSAAAARLEEHCGRIQAGIDLEKGPLMKLGLFRLPDGDRLLIVVHHLVMDAFSWRILFEDIDTLFRQYRDGGLLALPARTDSFQTWGEKLTGYARSDTFLKEIPYWQQLEQSSVPEIGRDFAGGTNLEKDKHYLSFSLDEAETRDLLTRVNVPFNTGPNDILLTALALSVRSLWGHRQVLAALEGHGREEIVGDVDVSRTIGWFTSVYPVVLDVNGENDISRQIKVIKEQLRRVPQRGIGHGILKYLAAAEQRQGVEFKLDPQISFNYLGQFDTDLKERGFAVAAESPGISHSPRAAREYEFDIVGLVARGRLTLTITYNRLHFREKTIREWLDLYRQQLRDLIEHCRKMERREPTPSDFTCSRLSIEAVDAIAARYGDDIQDIYPLSPMQEGMLFHTLTNRESAAYFEQIAYRLHGELDIEKVRQSLDELMGRHDILRTVFVHEGIDRPVQVVIKNRRVEFLFHDAGSAIQDGSAGDIEKEALVSRLKEEDRHRSFDLSRDVLMRISVIRLDRQEYEFIWSHHHILMDGWCNGILIAEFFEVYNARLENRDYRLPAAQPYRNYIEWLQQQDKQRSKAFWVDFLAGYEQTASVPRSGPPPEEEAVYAGRFVSFSLSATETEELQQIAIKNKVTLNTAVQAVWGVLLAAYNGTEDVIFGSVVSGRPADIENVETMVGLFINTLPVRVSVRGEMRWAELLRDLQKRAIAAEPHHYYPLAEIQAECELKRNLLDHIMIFENFPIHRQIEKMTSVDGAGRGRRSFSFSRIEAFEQTNYHFNLLVLPAEELRFKFEYNGHVYDRPQVEQTARHLKNVVVRILEDEHSRIRDIPLLSPEEAHRLVVEFNDNRADYPLDLTVAELFERRIPLNPARIAAVDTAGLSFLTFDQLNRRANQLAESLKLKGVGAHTITALMVDRRLEMMVGIVAVMKAGSAYLPLALDYPAARIRGMLKDSQAPLLLARIDDAAEKNIEGVDIVDPFREDNYQGRGDNPVPVNRPGDPIHVLYTSGSTGHPRGVLLEHRSVVNFIYDLHENFYKKWGAPLNLALIAPYVFAGSVKQIFSALLFGHSLFIVPEEARFDGAALAEFFHRYAVDITDATPVHLRMMIKGLRSRADRRCPVKHFNVSADILTRETVRELGAIITGDIPEIANMYGPTECCVDAAGMTVNSREIERLNSVPIGKPMANARIYILDLYQRPCPVGVLGELYIGGEGLARGYLNRPELTAERFPLIRTFPGSGRLYRSGDLARFLGDGNIEYAGRSDNQVNVRGYRIELGEIRHALLRYAGIEEAVVISRSIQQESHLIAYIKTSRAGTLPGDIRTFLSRYLPVYMLPSFFVQIPDVPLKSNGKIDYRVLPVPVPERGQAPKNDIPANETEREMRRIWSDILDLEVEEIGLNDDFFERGGNSITIFKMRHHIQRVFKRDISMSALFLYPTVRKLAAHIHEESVLGETECIVKLNRGGNNKNIFIIHPMHGMVYPYRGLAKGLEDQFNVYGIQARGLAERSRFPETLADMVADYVRQIRKVQPQGPYIIAGYCFGDIVAYHLVWQLERMNEQVEQLVMFDEPAFIPGRVIRYLKWKTRLGPILKPLKYLCRRLGLFSGPSGLKEEWPPPEDSEAPEGDVDRQQAEIEARIKAMDKEYWARNPYCRQPGLIRAPLAIIKARDRQNPGFDMKYLGRMSLGDVRLAESPGSHETIFEPQHLAELAGVVIKVLT